MQIEKDQSETIPQKDDDIKFDRENITTTDSQSPDPEQLKTDITENTILPNEELSKTEVVPLSEEEKQPKLGEEGLTTPALPVRRRCSLAPAPAKALAGALCFAKLPLPGKEGAMVKAKAIHQELLLYLRQDFDSNNLS